MALATQENQYLSGRAVLNCSDKTEAEVDQEVMLILKRAYEEAKRLLSENREAMDRIAEFLIERETITGKEFMKIFREVKGIPEPEEQTAPEKEPSEKDVSENSISDKEIPEEANSPEAQEQPAGSQEAENIPEDTKEHLQ